MARGHSNGTKAWASGRLVLLVSTAVLAVAVGGAARADDPSNPLGNPDEIGSVNGQSRPDTDLTPNAKKEAPMWRQRGGALFRTGEMFPDSPTSYDDDLTAIAFENPTNGMAGGTRKITCDGEEKSVPVIYAYHDTPEHGLAWERSRLASAGDCDDPGGYVGA